MPNEAELRLHRCCFTGHRPEKLDESPEEIQAWLEAQIDKAVADDEWFACNPGANTTHIRFKTKQLINNFLPAEKHKPEIIML